MEEAQRAINAAHVEAESCENCIGLVKLMGRNSGMFSFYLKKSCLVLLENGSIFSLTVTLTESPLQALLQCMPPLPVGMWIAV